MMSSILAASSAYVSFMFVFSPGTTVISAPGMYVITTAQSSVAKKCGSPAAL